MLLKVLIVLMAENGMHVRFQTLTTPSMLQGPGFRESAISLAACVGIISAFPNGFYIMNHIFFDLESVDVSINFEHFRRGVTNPWSEPPRCVAMTFGSSGA